METNKTTKKNKYASPIGFGWYTSSKPIRLKVKQFTSQNEQKINSI